MGAIARLRQERRTGAAITRQLGLKRSTVGAVLRRLGLGRLVVLDAKLPIVRYQRDHPGELIHIDTKKLGRIARPSHRVPGNRRDAVRGAGWEYLHVAVDDASRLAYTEAMASGRKAEAAFLTRALAFFAAHGAKVERVMTDHRPRRGRSVAAGACAERRTRGSAFRSRLFQDALTDAGCRHIRTRPYTPKTNGKAERFIQTSLRAWAYAQAYQTSLARTEAMQPWLGRYNHHRPHAALGGQPPITRLNNVAGFDS